MIFKHISGSSWSGSSAKQIDLEREKETTESSEIGSSLMIVRDRQYVQRHQPQSVSYSWPNLGQSLAKNGCAAVCRRRDIIKVFSAVSVKNLEAIWQNRLKSLPVCNYPPPIKHISSYDPAIRSEKMQPKNKKGVIVVNKYYNGTIIAGCINLFEGDQFKEGPAACYSETNADPMGGDPMVTSETGEVVAKTMSPNDIVVTKTVSLQIGD
ncbi:hypothetical protein TELCIR_11680, partial [Teladorsagia circumcincta]